MKTNLFLIGTAVLLLANSCNEVNNTEPEKAEAPKLISSEPADGAKGIDYDKELKITFTYDQNIKCLYSDFAQIKVNNDAEVIKVNPFNTDLEITIGSLKGSSEYEITIPDGIVKGFKENQEAAAGFKYTFTTKDAPIVVDPDDDVPEPQDNDAWNRMNELGLGWNLGNHFDAFYNGSWAGDKFLYPDETCWGNGKVTAATFTKLYVAGFRTVRIPITWLKMIGEAPDYKIDETWMNRIVQVVGWARDAGLKVLINTHHDEDHYIGNEAMGHRWLNIMDATKNEEVNKEVKEKIKGVWTNIANAFKDEGDYLIFEGFNEINDGNWGNSANSSDQAKVLNEWNQVFVDAVRATGSKNAERWLGVPTYCTSINFIADFVLPEDPAGHLMVSVHSYDPYNYTIAANLPQKLWGHTFTGNDDEKQIRSIMATLHANFVSKGIPVYLGEFGCSMREYDSKEWKSYKYYLEYFVKASKSYGVPCFIWDNGNKGAGSEHHPYIDHATGSYIEHSKELIDVMVKAMYDNSSEYTLKSLYDNAPRP
ncbi:MAG: cellulase family glycosylhydrolase [Bacteroidales bacterium]|nr:cellulase family glycosylhydrolase [Bacteroidales bacterium]